MKREYRSTEADLRRAVYDTWNHCEGTELMVPDPEPPEGEGWDLRGMIRDGERVIWSWQRDLPEEQDERIKLTAPSALYSD